MAEAVDIYIGATALLTALGDKSTSLKSMGNGMCGLKYDARFGMTVGAIRESCEVDGYTRFESLIVKLVWEVLEESGLRLNDKDVQLVISTTKGDVGLLGERGEIPSEAYLYNTALHIADYFGCVNRPVVISNACISGVSAFIFARDILKSSSIRHAIVVGCDVLSEFITSGFASFKSVSPNPCKPYDAQRDGLTLGEACGAAVLTIDKAYASRPFVRLAGGCVTNDANHISGPSRTGDGLYYAIAGALNEAAIEPSCVGFVNTHGTATLYNDEMESKAVVWAGLAETPLNGLKGYIGHTLGASGIVETIICAEELRRGRLFGTLGYSEQGTSAKLSVSPNEQSIDSSSCCVKTASGFGGCNAAIVLDADEQRRTVVDNHIEASVVVDREYMLSQSELSFDEFIRAEYKKLAEPNMKFYKMSDLCKAVYVATENLLHGFDFSQYEPTRRAIILANSVSSLEADYEHQCIVDRRLPEGASPAVFVYTLPNVAAGEVCIRHKFQGDNTFFIEEADSGLAENYARRLISAGKADIAVCGWCDKLGENLNVNLKLLKK